MEWANQWANYITALQINYVYWYNHIWFSGWWVSSELSEFINRRTLLGSEFKWMGFEGFIIDIYDIVSAWNSNSKLESVIFDLCFLYQLITYYWC